MTKDHLCQKALSLKSKRIAIYAAFRSADCTPGRGLTEQLQRCLFELAKHPDWTLIGVYADDLSASSARPELKRLLHLCSEGRYELILTVSVRRFSRDTAKLLSILRELERANTDVFFIRENLFARSPQRKMLCDICASLTDTTTSKEASYADYSDQSSENPDAAEA